MELDVVEVRDLDAAWPDIRRLFIALDEYHQPLTGRRLGPDWEELFRSHLEEVAEGLVLLARAGEQAIGFTNARLDRRTFFIETLGYVENMYVEAEWRSKGVGRAMLSRVEDWSRVRGADQVRLSVVAANAAGIAAWSALGFEPFSHTVRKPLLP